MLTSVSEVVYEQVCTSIIVSNVTGLPPLSGLQVVVYLLVLRQVGTLPYNEPGFVVTSS